MDLILYFAEALGMLLLPLLVVVPVALKIKHGLPSRPMAFWTIAISWLLTVAGIAVLAKDSYNTFAFGLGAAVLGALSAAIFLQTFLSRPMPKVARELDVNGPTPLLARVWWFGWRTAVVWLTLVVVLGAFAGVLAQAFGVPEQAAQFGRFAQLPALIGSVLVVRRCRRRMS